MVDLNRIETFLHAAETLNFSEAARILHLTQPTVSHHIKNLEQELGVELFKRKDGAIKLTEAGRLLVPWARRMMQGSIEMQEMMESLKVGIAGNLYIACSTTADIFGVVMQLQQSRVGNTLLRAIIFPPILASFSTNAT